MLSNKLVELETKSKASIVHAINELNSQTLKGAFFTINRGVVSAERDTYSKIAELKIPSSIAAGEELLSLLVSGCAEEISNSSISVLTNVRFTWSSDSTYVDISCMNLGSNHVFMEEPFMATVNDEGLFELYMKIAKATDSRQITTVKVLSATGDIQVRHFHQVNSIPVDEHIWGEFGYGLCIATIPTYGGYDYSREMNVRYGLKLDSSAPIYSSNNEVTILGLNAASHSEGFVNGVAMSQARLSYAYTKAAGSEQLRYYKGESSPRFKTQDGVWNNMHNLIKAQATVPTSVTNNTFIGVYA